MSVLTACCESQRKPNENNLRSRSIRWAIFLVFFDVLDVYQSNKKIAEYCTMIKYVKHDREWKIEDRHLRRRIRKTATCIYRVRAQTRTFRSRWRPQHSYQGHIGPRISHRQLYYNCTVHIHQWSNSLRRFHWVIPKAGQDENKFSSYYAWALLSSLVPAKVSSFLTHFQRYLHKLTRTINRWTSWRVKSGTAWCLFCHWCIRIASDKRTTSNRRRVSCLSDSPEVCVTCPCQSTNPTRERQTAGRKPKKPFQPQLMTINKCAVFSLLSNQGNFILGIPCYYFCPNTAKCQTKRDFARDFTTYPIAGNELTWSF